MALGPLLMQPILKPKVWGGRRLESLQKRLPPGQLIGESWELADLPAAITNDRTLIANGPFAGRTLHEAIEDSCDAIMGRLPLSTEGGFPLLLKYLDANENLSVQVHPDAPYVAKHPGTHVKSEAWVILHAEPGSVIYRGVRPEVTREQFAEHIRSGGIIDDLIAIQARAGDCHYLPSGTCHALGGGIMLAEIQTPSDTTFRVYDWGRPPAAGRELHIEQALECIRFGHAQFEHQRDLPAEELPPVANEMQIVELCRCEHFRIERIDAFASSARPFRLSGPDVPEVWMVLAGSMQIESADAPAARLSTGITSLFPASLQAWDALIDEKSRWLRITLPRPPGNEARETC